MSEEAAEAPAAGPAIRRRGLMFVLSSPSGAGKTTISRELMARDGNLAMSVSVTTRQPRPGEEDGVDYHFIDDLEFLRMVADDELLEHATVFGHSYGTPRAAVEAELEAGRDVLFDIDWQGTQQLRNRARDDLVSVFILPPTTAELERRLHARAQDSDEVVRQRMERAADEMSHFAEYDYIIINVDRDTSVEEARHILTAERLRNSRQTGLPDFVRSLQQS